jgi:hypothetical protein
MPATKSKAKQSILWVHGNMVEPEHPASLMQFARRGWGAQCRGMAGMTNWFHFPVAAPTVINGSPLYLRSVFILFNTMPAGPTMRHPAINHVHIYDGRTLAMSFEDLALCGGHDEHVDEVNTLKLNPALRIANGLGLSVAVSFPTREGQESIGYDVLFTAAGAEFAS